MTFQEQRFFEIAMANEGVVHRSVLREAGVTRKRQRTYVDRGVLRPVTTSVFVLGSPSLSWSQRLRVALAHAGPGSALSHACGASVWQLPRLGRGSLEVTVARGAHRPTLPYGRVHRSRDLRNEDLRTVDGLCVTAPGRTLFDLAGRLGPAVLDVCLQDLCRRSLVTIEELHGELERRRRRGLVGVTRMEALLDGAVDVSGADSWLEARFLRLVADYGLPRPELQVPFEVDGHRYRVDALWRAARLIVELKGYGTHATRTEIGADAEREARLGTLGLTVISFTHDQVVSQPQFVVAQIASRVLGPGRSNRQVG